MPDAAAAAPQSPPALHSDETLLAFDVGARRIGVAVGNTVVRVAHAATIVTLADDADAMDAVAPVIEEWRPQRLVVGIPYTEYGTPSTGSAQARCEAFAAALEARFGAPVERVDERYSSLDAAAIPRARRRAGTSRRAKRLDDVAAQVILQRWLDALPVAT